MLLSVNLLAEFCSLILCLLIIVTSYKKAIGQSKLFKLFTTISYTLLICILVNILRYSVLDINLKYAFTLAFHVLNSFLFYLFILYSIKLTPIRNEDFCKYKYFFLKVYLFLIFIIVSSPITKIVYYIDDNEIIKGPVAFISFLSGYLAMMSIIIVALIKQKTSKKIKRNILFILAIISLTSIIEFIYPTCIIHGFGYVCVHLVMYQAFHFNNYDFYYGVSTESLLIDKFKKLKKTKADFSFIVLDILNLNYLNNTISVETINCYLFDIFRECEASKYNPEVFSWKNKFAILLKGSCSEDFIDFLEKKLDSYILSKEFDTLDYKIACLQTPNMINSLDKFSNLENNDKIHFVSEEEIKNSDKKVALIKEIDKIFNLYDLSDPRVEVFYQPILDNNEMKFLSAEALSRLNIKELGGYIFPDEFIPILEEKNYIHKYSMIILNKVCCFINQLNVRKINFEGISVNFSLGEFLDDNFEEDVLNIVNKNGVNPSSIHIEITESVKVTNMKLVKKKVENLKTYGFKFYLDDFGTGYSNLSEVIEFPVDVIKFDKSLVWNSIKNKEIEYLTKGMAKLLRKNFKILFEGIEDIEHEDFAKQLKIDFSQGYKYYKPLKPSDAIEIIGTEYKR